MNKGILIILALLLSLNLHSAEVRQPFDKTLESGSKFDKARMLPKAAEYENSFERASWGNSDNSGSLRALPPPDTDPKNGSELGTIGEALWFLLGIGLLYGLYVFRKRQGKGYMKKMICILLLAWLPLSGFSNPTQQQVIDDLNSRVGQCIDWDGYYGCQCVDLIMWLCNTYFNWAPFGNAVDYTTINLPAGWQRIRNSATFIPEPGDVFIGLGGIYNATYGHIGIIESANINTFRSFEENGANGSLTKGSPLAKFTRNYNGFWGVLRPPYANPTPPPPPAPVTTINLMGRINAVAYPATQGANTLVKDMEKNIVFTIKNISASTVTRSFKLYLVKGTSNWVIWSKTVTLSANQSKTYSRITDASLGEAINQATGNYQLILKGGGGELSAISLNSSTIVCETSGCNPQDIRIIESPVSLSGAIAAVSYPATQGANTFLRGDEKNIIFTLKNTAPTAVTRSFKLFLVNRTQELVVWEKDNLTLSPNQSKTFSRNTDPSLGEAINLPQGAYQLLLCEGTGSSADISTSNTVTACESSECNPQDVRVLESPLQITGAINAVAYPSSQGSNTFISGQEKNIVFTLRNTAPTAVTRSLKLFLTNGTDHWVIWEKENVTVQQTKTFSRTTDPSLGTAINLSPGAYRLFLCEGTGSSADISINDKVIVCETAGCNPQSIQVLRQETALDEVKVELPVTVSPNPTAGIVYVENAGGREIAVYNLVGKLLLRTNTGEVDLSDYPKGIYLLQVGNKSYKVIRQ